MGIRAQIAVTFAPLLLIYRSYTDESCKTRRNSPPVSINWSVAGASGQMVAVSDLLVFRPRLRWQEFFEE